MASDQRWAVGPSVHRIRAELEEQLTEEARAWLGEALAAACAPRGKLQRQETPSPPVWQIHFAAAGRRCQSRPTDDRAALAGMESPTAAPPGRRASRTSVTSPSPSPAPRSSTTGPTAARDAAPHADLVDAARVLLLHAAQADSHTVMRLYHQGSRSERRAVLWALPYLDLGDSALPLIEDALRTNDTRIMIAALGPYSDRHLDAHTWRQAVLKCLFTEVSVTVVAGLERRARGDAELARMLNSFADERNAAGRPVPEDLHHLLALTSSGPVRQES
ncbi:EboA domain-containing protein [Streptomyces sp. NPDC048639]|uniref:EboA domain-containing protein n=1 Tax=Streptomyces sp. NPDC048639 TaxID=3365581 RepID=UPI00371A648D